MMRSLFSGVAGLRTHQTKMDVIGNNIANVNTIAYKSSSIVFSDLMSQTTKKASGANVENGTGGVNARQVGLGVQAGAVNVNITGQGSSQSTGNPLDLMITGDNFFVINNGRENMFSRDGSFYVDGFGNLATTSMGYNVMGWGVNEETGAIKKDTVAALRIMSTANLTYPPEATSKAYVSGILDKNDRDVTSTNGRAVNLNLFDDLGYSYTAKFSFKQSQDENQYSLEFLSLLDSQGNEVDISPVIFGTENAMQEKTNLVAFDSATYHWDNEGVSLLDVTGNVVVSLSDFLNTDGTLKTESGDPEEAELATQSFKMLAKIYGYEGSENDFYNLYTHSEVENSTDNISVLQMLVNRMKGSDVDAFPVEQDVFTTDGRYYEGASILFNPDNGKFAGINGQITQNTIGLNLSALGGNFSDISVDFSECAMFDNKGTSTLSATSGDFDGLGAGRRLGDMIGVSVQSNGMIYASYDNGMTKLLGQIATAAFPNASGLERAGDNLYRTTLNSGDFDDVGVDITESGGYISTGQLEMSNVDLSVEFTEMITTQRGFQANSRVITVSDTLLEELTNLKR